MDGLSRIWLKHWRTKRVSRASTCCSCRPTKCSNILTVVVLMIPVTGDCNPTYAPIYWCSMTLVYVRYSRQGRRTCMM